MNGRYYRVLIGAMTLLFLFQGCYFHAGVGSVQQSTDKAANTSQEEVAVVK